MSVSYIPCRVRIRLWGKAAGRCQYEGCKEPLWLDMITKAEFNKAYIAHIRADRPGGARYHSIHSEELKADISNLMLMCDAHHRLIDIEDKTGHPVERLVDMKRRNEDRLELLTSLTENKRSHVLLYGANVGQHTAPVGWEKSVQAMFPDWFPAEKPAIELGLRNSFFQDNEQKYWLFERENLQKQFAKTVQPRIAAGQVEHFSVFALAPQPLLMELGRLLSDIPTAEVYQLHREPPNWMWQENPQGFDFILHEPNEFNKTVALNLSLSATVDNSRLIPVLGKKVSIWTLTVEYPNNDFLKSREQLSQFRQVFRGLLDRVKATHGQDAVLHLFPAVPVAIAVEIGRVWMPKADLPLRIYDQNRGSGGFVKVFDIPNKST